MMIGSQIYIEVKTLGSKAFQRFSLSDCSLALNLILPPPSTKQLFIVNRSGDTAWRNKPCGVPASLCTTKL